MSAMQRQSTVGKDVSFERIRRITGYLVGTMDKWNDAKKAEEQAKKPSADELYGNVPLNKEFVREQKPASASIKAVQPKPTQSQAAQSEQEAGSAPSSSAGGEA